MESKKTHYAHCIINQKGDDVYGIVRYTQVEGEQTRIQARIEGLSKGLHGFHIHEFGNLEKGCISAGGHYNPHGKNHGGPDDEDRHVGDMGNIESDGKVAVYDRTDRLIMLYGEFSVIGRATVVHAGPDDLGKGGFEDSLTTGHAGARLGCGVIGISGPW